MGRHEKIIELITTIEVITPTYIHALAAEKIAEHIYNREVALKKIIMCLINGAFIVGHHRVEIPSASMGEQDPSVLVIDRASDSDNLVLTLEP